MREIKVLEVIKLGKNFGLKPILKEIDLTVARGERVAILGDSGCGKTTLLKTIAGFYLPHTGEIRVEGKIISRPGWALFPNRRHMSMVFQSAALFPHMTVEENIGFGNRKDGKVSARVKEIAEAFRIDSLLKSYPHSISGGQARRVALARALAAEPSYLLMDEPFTNLDRELKSDVMTYVKNFAQERNIGVIMVTHQEEEARYLADMVYVMEEGKLEVEKR
ncbi:ABC transporter [Thermosyntropha lipolytica DSM 11003]|uniref:ABC transporter n=1 Tax=Thermosyntropha lipolytica DSM 11003 TaxID=1123382 RepID=A0A1M5K3I2_9FIRM|nr:ATP-binding cassette domain-containing protein [Thermosyntropha lipolytica]SHG47160.1 ABC transporter [Thermosyntropha lipolytica DSM 11003]